MTKLKLEVNSLLLAQGDFLYTKWLFIMLLTRTVSGAALETPKFIMAMN